MTFCPASIHPNFLFIGGSKSGSSWIYQVLREHPEIFLPKAKDIQYFDRFFDKGENWYLKVFQNSAGAKAVGEVAHDYFLSEQTATRIHNLLPNVRLLCCLREPLERTISGYLYNKLTTVNEHTSFSKYAWQPEILKQNEYYGNLLPFYRLFPKNNILVLFFDDLKQNPAGFIKNIYAFLNVDTNFIPPSLERIVLPARAPRMFYVAHFAYRVGGLLRKIGFSNLVGTIKQNSMFDRILYRPIQRKPEISQKIKREFLNHFRKNYANLAQLIGRELPSSWFREQL